MTTTETSDDAFAHAILIAHGAWHGDLDDAKAEYESALRREGKSEIEVADATLELDDACKDDSGSADSEIWECREGKLPTPLDDETQTEANARVCRTLRKIGEPLPGSGTPLGDWITERQIASTDE